MKPIKAAFLFLAVILNFSSCETLIERTQTRNSHNREIRAELVKYSDVLDLARTEIYFEGGAYYLTSSSAPSIYLSLYVKPDHSNREMLFSIRDGLIDFFENYWNTANEGHWLPYMVAINFTLGETKTYYSVLYFISGWYKRWYERWYSELFGKPIIENSYINEDSYMWRFGKPLIEDRTIQELDTLLRKYADSMDIERFDGYHLGEQRKYIRIWLLIPYNYNRRTVLAIRDDFVNFFGSNRQELIEKYGQFDTIHINFYRMEDIILRITDRKQMVVKTEMPVYELVYENNEWLERRGEPFQSLKPLGENSILME